MGKIGIILAFLLSMAAAGGSYYLYQGWVEARTVQSNTQAKYDQVKFEKEQIRAEKEKIASEKEQISARGEEYRSKAEAMQSQLGKLQAAQSRIDSEKTALEKKLAGHQKIIAELQTKMGELEQKAKDAQAACGVSPADMKTDPFAATQSSPLVFKPVTSGSTTVGVTPVPSAASSAVREISQTTGTSNSVASATSLTQLAAAAETTGPKVLTVNRKYNFVVINQGLQEGLQMGDKLTVLRQGVEIATIQIEKLYDKFSAATLVNEDPNQRVVEGDEIRKA